MDPFKDPYFLMPVEDPHDTNVRCAPILSTLLPLFPPAAPPPALALLLRSSTTSDRATYPSIASLTFVSTTFGSTW